MLLHRALIRTHHMTSRKKISAISKAAKTYDCAVYLKTGAHPPGVMIGECEDGEGVEEWVKGVKRLRYKDYQLLLVEAVSEGRLNITPGNVKEFESMKALATDLAGCGILDWWERGMGFTRGHDAQD